MIENGFFKFPSTPYLFNNKLWDVRNDKTLTQEETNNLFEGNITIEEKIDGANLGISYDSMGNLLLQNRGHYITSPYLGQWSPLAKWIEVHQPLLFDVLEDRFILFGEWCYCSHSIFYDELPDWFIGFDIYDKEEQFFLPVEKRNIKLESMRISKVPQLFSGITSLESINGFFVKSEFGNEEIEGLYFRKENCGKLTQRAKYVRETFSNSISQHWTKGIQRKNKIRLAY